jgi:hypothetical protein
MVGVVEGASQHVTYGGGPLMSSGPGAASYMLLLALRSVEYTDELWKICIIASQIGKSIESCITGKAVEMHGRRRDWEGQRNG